MVAELIAALGAGLSIWNSKSARKYTDMLLGLQGDYYEAFNAEPRDNAKLDHAEYQLRNFSRVVTAEIRASQAGTKS